MDELNHQLVALLRLNARESTSSLARKLNISRSTVQSRMENLQRKKVIDGYTIRYHEEYKRHLITAHVLIRVNPKQSSQVVVELKKLAEVRVLYAISGEYDLIALLEASSTQDVDAALDNIGNLSGIEKTTSSIVLSTKFDRLV